MISKGTPNEVFQTDLVVKLSPQEFRAVYTVPLSVEKTFSGHIRYMKDVYTQDRRIINEVINIKNRQDQFAKSVVAAPSGSLLVQGEPGPGQYNQKVVVVKCGEPTQSTHPRSAMVVRKVQCAKPIAIALNQGKS